MMIPYALLVVMAFATAPAATEEQPPVLTVFSGRATPPGLNWLRKCWWVKEITPDLHISGRLTEKQIKYAADSGFKTIVSLYTYPDSQEKKTFGGDPLPNTEEERTIVEDIAGMSFVSVLPPDASWTDWCSKRTVETLTEILSSVERPVLLHDDKGNQIPFSVLLYLANQTRLDPKFEPRITSDDVYKISAAMGLDFTDRMQMEVVWSVTGETIPNNPTRPDTDPEDWEDYWIAHPVYKGWFTAGQITPSHIKVLEQVGFKNVINLRSGIIFDGEPNQEEVNLLNIQSGTGTYASDGKEPRQSKSRLEETRIDSYRPNYFISPTSPVNYESVNAEEFGDTVGYREDLERQAFERSSLKYHHMPVKVIGPYSGFLERELPKILDIGKDGPVLVQCTMARRAAYVAVLAAALQYDKDLAWALRRTRELGFEVSEEKMPELYHSYEHWLVSKRIRNEL